MLIYYFSRLVVKEMLNITTQVIQQNNYCLVTFNEIYLPKNYIRFRNSTL